MTTVILIGGLLMVAALAVAMIDPKWRLPALAFGLLALPGNIDDLLPQMVLDPHPVIDATAAIITFADLLLAWAVILTETRERRPIGTTIRQLIALAIALATIAAIVSIVNLAQGVDRQSSEASCCSHAFRRFSTSQGHSAPNSAMVAYSRTRSSLEESSSWETASIPLYLPTWTDLRPRPSGGMGSRSL